MAYIDVSDKKVRAYILSKYDGRCAYCGCAITMETLTIDHIIPLRRKMNSSNAGKNEMKNLNPACLACNVSKASLDLEDWRMELLKKLDRLHVDSSLYRLCKRFGFIQEIFPDEVVFYFEK